MTRSDCRTRRPPVGQPRTAARGPHAAAATPIGPHSRQVIAARRYGTSQRNRAHPNGRNRGDVWSIHTCPYWGPQFAAFPIDIPLRCIQAGCKPGGTVLDPFCGTGTMGIAARQLGRRFTGIDLNPAFLALAAERLRQAATQPPSGTANRCDNGTATTAVTSERDAAAASYRQVT